MQTVLQQMLPFGIERLRGYPLCRSFLLRYRAIPGCDANSERKNEPRISVLCQTLILRTARFLGCPMDAREPPRKTDCLSFILLAPWAGHRQFVPCVGRKRASTPQAR